MKQAITIDQNKRTESGVSARRKVLQLGVQLGLAVDGDYKPSEASIAARGEYRERKTLVSYQANLESIYNQAIEHTPSDVTGIDLDPDWLHNFFKMAEQIHNPKMQNLWSRILAKEIIKPGNFSIRTLERLKQLTQREALILEKALGLGCTINGETRLKLIYCSKLTGGLQLYFRSSSVTSIDLSLFGLPYSSILSLINAGIIHHDEFETGRLTKNQSVTLTYPHTQLTLKPKRGNLIFGYYRFTSIGNELAQLVFPNVDTKFTKAMSALMKNDFDVQ
ncbi:TIGR03899 family protein [Parashewanella spongiae]|uniref:TIGR03899 family protein n=1 Tax=Parashewanella spongiae TaxID=342950 RepID=A0A3A6TUU5_9GAMM|nr:TIGR03899 family protein [Parashewanella spongiae]MCL1078822.1 TIGR03899 family protein [Parashewanella spongiae]RJY11899.1 TIGR03899 family protein [Parashewanella spongiae]